MKSIMRITTIVILFCCPPALAQTAGMLSFQGLLKDAGGVPVNGPVTLQFRIYDAQTGGALVDMDGNGLVEDVVGKDAKEVSTTATKGIVSTKFGPVSPKAFNGQARWLEVRVNGTALSRTEMATAAATAEQVNKAGSGGSAINVDGNGWVGIGTPAPQAKLDIVQATPDTSPLRLLGDYDYAGYMIPEQLAIRGYSDPTKCLKLGYHTVYNFGAVQATQIARGPSPLILNPAGGRVGIGTTPDPDTTLHVQAAGVEFKLTDSNHGSHWWMRHNAGGSEFVVGYGGSSADENIKLCVRHDGTTRLRVLQITGGSDLAEPFVVGSDPSASLRTGSATERRSDEGAQQASDGAGGGPAANSQRDTRDPQLPAPQPGHVVVIDPDHPGRLKLASTPYDRKVAGVISGANGLKPGMVMSGLGSDEATKRRSDEGKADTLTPSLSLEGRRGAASEHPVALTGRVYVWADASYGPITPGDLLTTSATAGHAMRADEKKDFPRGCIIGKAMSRLEAGKGLVLVLVQPQ